MNSLKDVVSHFKAIYQTEPEFIVRAPGRINLIGEHTDYNDGWVLPASIDKAIYFAVKRNGTKECQLSALDIDQKAKMALPVEDMSGPLWVQYIKGICHVLQKAGYRLEGFDCVFGGDIPIGSGLSSSAALDCGMIKSLSVINKLHLGSWDIVTSSNRSNNQYLNIQSGILDQFASVFGEENMCLSLDCRSRKYKRHEIDLGDYELVLINTNVKHEHSDSGYNDRPAECKAAVQALNNEGIAIQSLRDLDFERLHAVQNEINPTLYKRARFIIEENQRVHAFIDALHRKDSGRLGALLYASHDGLQNLYEVSCAELDLLVELTRDLDEVVGARMMGGGFGGCTLNLILSKKVDAVIQQITSAYRSTTSINPAVYRVKISNGLSVL